MSDIISLIGWTFLPSLATSTLLSISHRLLPSLRTPASSPAHRRQYNILHTTIITLYLFYTVYTSITTLPPTYYSVLQSSPASSTAPSQLRSKFRRLSVQYHPDKMRNSSSDDSSANGDPGEMFMLLKTAYDTLSDANRRWAYDRFGAEVEGWKNTVTAWEYLLRGVTTKIMGYVGTLTILIGMSAMGKFETGKFWRFLILACLLSIESFILTRPYNVMERIVDAVPLPAAAEGVVAWAADRLGMRLLLPYEQLHVLHRFSLSLFFAISQLAPLWQPAPSPLSSTAALKKRVENLLGIARFADAEANKVMTTEFLPFEAAALRGADGEGEEGGDGGRKGGELIMGLQRKMGRWMVEQAVRNDPEVREVMGNVIRRRRKGAPAGAKGA